MKRRLKSTRHHVMATIKEVYAVLQALGLRIHPDTTSIGRVEKGVDFLGVHCRPTGMTVSEATLSRQDHKVTRLYEQGALKERVGAYLRRWLGWAGTLVVLVVAGGCAAQVFDCGGGVKGEWGGAVGSRGKDNAEWGRGLRECLDERCGWRLERKSMWGPVSTMYYTELVQDCRGVDVQGCAKEKTCAALRRAGK